MAYRAWGFNVQDITTPVFVWHGEDDDIAHPAIGRSLAKTIPHCQATFVPHVGHFLALTHWREIVSQLIMA
jgi:pimeloyl-ACP methyl ester carboxylesterase